MCHWCENSLIADSLTSGLWGLAADRRQFMSYAVSAGAVAAASLIPSFPAFAASGADVIFRNGAIYSMTAARAPAEALAIGRERILAVGSEAEVAALTGPATRIVDLQGRTVLPGLIDPHHHTVLAALLSDVLINVGYAKNPRHDAALPALRAEAAKTPPGDWITAGFYDNLLQGGNLSMQELDAISTRHPIFVLYVNGHVGAGNALAFERAKITENVGQLPGGGHFGRGPDGKLNGLIYEEPALLRFLDVAVAKPTPARMAEAISKYAKQAVPRGNTTLHEPGTVKPEWVEPLARLSTTLPLRLSASFSTAMLDASKAYAAIGLPRKARRIPGSRFSLYGMKFWADGSNQAETAAQTEPYLHSSAKGQANYSVAQMADLCRKAKDAGWPILIHCQGDAAVDDGLDAIEQAYGASPATGINRIEHATMARPDQIDRMKRLGVEPSFIPDFVYLYGAAYRDQIFGAPRAEFMVPAGAAAKAGLGFSLHSDNPAAGLPVNPLRHVQTAVTRRCVIDNSIVGLGVALTVDQALRAITVNAARQIGLEDAIGTLEKGKEADLTILEGDPYKTDPEKITAIKVSETWVAGERKFQA
jgi:predicted amidohydrolase YtcJ